LADSEFVCIAAEKSASMSSAAARKRQNIRVSPLETASRSFYGHLTGAARVWPNVRRPWFLLRRQGTCPHKRTAAETNFLRVNSVFHVFVLSLGS